MPCRVIKERMKPAGKERHACTFFFFKGASEKARREVKENKRKLQQFEMTGGDEDREAIVRTHGGRRRADKRKWEFKKNLCLIVTLAKMFDVRKPTCT